MAIIYTYPTKTDPVSDDTLLISDSEDGNKTKQVSIHDIRSATVSGVSSIIAGTPNVTLDPAAGTGDVTISVSSSGVTDFTNSNGTFVNFGTTNTNATGAVTVGNVDLSATGTPSSTTFLRGDNSWATAATAAWTTINGTTSNIEASSAGATATFAVNTDTNFTIVGNVTDTLTFTLGVPTATKKGGVTAIAGPSAIPTQAASGIWYPIDNVEEDQSRLAVRIPATNGGSAEEVIETVSNNSGVSIPKGSPLHITGNDGTNPTVEIANASSTVSMPVSGLANETIANGATGEMMIVGIMSGINTSGLDGATPNEGDIVYVNNAAGTGSIPWLTTTQATGQTNLIQNVGIIVRDDITQGSIQVTCTGRANATPNLDRGSIFIGDSNNESSILNIGNSGTVLTSDGATASWQNVSPNGILLNSTVFAGTNTSQTDLPRAELTEITSTFGNWAQIRFNPATSGTGTTIEVFGSCPRPATSTNYVRIAANFFIRQEDTDGTTEECRMFFGMHHNNSAVRPRDMRYGWQMMGIEDTDIAGNYEIIQRQFYWDVLVSDLVLTNGNPASSGDTVYFYLKGAWDSANTTDPNILFGQWWKDDLATITQNDMFAAGPCTIDVYEIEANKYSVNPNPPAVSE